MGRTEPDGEVLLVCSGGGHLRQLAGFVERLGYTREQQVWVTFENGLSESLLAGRNVIWAPFTAPRDAKNFSKLVAMAPRILARHDFTTAISTGSSPAVAFLPQAAMRGVSAHYIESAARADGPSLTGKLISRMPRIHTYCQYPAWSSEKWKYLGSIFDSFEPAAIAEPKPPRRAVVSVGTQRGYPFTSLLEAVVPLLREMDEVLYQTGDADVASLGITGVESVPHDELRRAIREADVVITHAGVGAAITALEAGKHPILIPRQAALHEHIDDHQVQVARELSHRGLATLRYPQTLAFDDLVAASTRSTRVTVPPPVSLS